MMSKIAQESALQEFFVEGEEILQRVSQLLTALEGNGPSSEDIDSLYRDVHTLKGSAQLFGFSGIGTIAHAVEASLEPVRQRTLPLSPEFVDIIFASLDLIGKVLKEPSLDLERDIELQREMGLIIPRLIEIATKKFEAASRLSHDHYPSDDAPTSVHTAPAVPELATSSEILTLEIAQRPGSPIKESPEVSGLVKDTIKPQITEVPQSSPEVPRKASMTEKQDELGSENNSIRVQVNLLDKLMNLVGEMVLTRNQVLQYARVSEDAEFLKLTQRLDLVTAELQDNVMRTRMQPIGTVFSKFQRLVRDLGRDLSKNIELTITGAETELDKSLIEAIKDPLTHIVRNSCDHGIELPAARKASGKSEVGKLSLRAYHEGGQMIIEIKDDGGGLDPSKIRDKAIQKQIITLEKASTLTEKQIQELIFMPGFSTAEQVSAVSGRGVGMDVVKTNIEKIGGMVELDSVHRQYTKIRLRIPLTLAIVPAMIVSCGQESYAIPQVKLQELLRVDLDEGGKIEMLQGQLIYRLRDQLLPLVSLKQIISGKEDSRRSVFNIVVLQTTGHAFGLIVDEIKDTADIVVKPLPNFLKKVEMFSGATIMGDGSVALIVDPQGISEEALGQRKENQSAKSEALADEKASALAISEYLLVKIADSVFAIPLVLVHRLEEFPRSSFDHSLEEIFVRYRDGLLPLLGLEKLLGIVPEVAQEETPVCPVVVISKNNRLYGLCVDQIFDIIQTEEEINAHIKQRDGLLGTVLSPNGDVLTVVDTYGIINKAMGVAVEEKKRAAKKVRVLLAEDTNFFVKQITKVLVEAGLEVTHAFDGEEAYRLLSDSRPSTFSLIVSDIEMPRLNGFGLAERIRADERFKDIPLIALTTRFKEADQERGKKAGFDRYLEKLQGEELIDTINSFLVGKR